MRVTMGGPAELNGTAPPKTQLISRAKLPCIHLGKRLPGQACGSAIHTCNLHGDKTNKTGPCGKGAARDCPSCADYATTKALPEPAAPFNASTIEYRGHLVTAYRIGEAASRLFIQAGDTHYPLAIKHHRARFSQEDPRLFIYRGRLHVMFVGVAEKQANDPSTVSVLYARLSEEFAIEEVFYPRFEYRQTTEKNWAPFEADDGNLYAVYSVAPHVVYRIDGNAAYPVHGTPNPFPWSGGALRGGAAPVRVGDVFYHWFHGVKRVNSVLTYSVGVCVFDARPPFRVLRQTAEPLLWGTAGRPGFKKAVVFPCGAYLKDDAWHVSCGVDDQRIVHYTWTVDQTEAALSVPNLPPDANDLPAELIVEIDAAASLPGWCPREKALLMASLVLRERPAVVVEIGVFGGRSLLPMALACKDQSHGLVYGIDPWANAAALEGTQLEKDAVWWKREDLRAVRRTFFAAVESYGVADHVRILEASSASVAAAFEPGSIDMLHIDGNHSEEVSERDGKAYLPRVRSGGWVWVDDTDGGAIGKLLAAVEVCCGLVQDYGKYRLYRKR